MGKCIVLYFQSMLLWMHQNIWSLFTVMFAVSYALHRLVDMYTLLPSLMMPLVTLGYIHWRVEVKSLLASKDLWPWLKISTIVNLSRTDRGGEYMSHELNAFLQKKGIMHQCFVPYTAQQKGVAEHKNGTLLEMAQCRIKGKHLLGTSFGWKLSCVQIMYWIEFPLKHWK